MLKAYIIAYCRQNLGDDMFVQSLVRRYPGILFNCNIAPINGKAFCLEKNLKMPSRLDFFLQRALNKLKLQVKDQYRRKRAKKSDLVIRIGGSIFIEDPSSSADHRDFSNYHNNEYIIGANFGPYYTDDYLKSVKMNLEGCTDICFRDKYSYNMFKNNTHVRYAPDVLFGYKFYPEYRHGNGVGISVIAAHERTALAQLGEAYYDTIAEVCDLLITKKIPVRLFAFCEREGDMRAIDCILERTSNKDLIEICQYAGNIDGVLTEINACEYMIATRFHAMILAWAMGKKVLPVIYSQKQAHVLDDLSYDGYVWNLLGGELPVAGEIVKQCLAAENTLDMDYLAKNAEKQFAGIDMFLQNKTEKNEICD